MRMQGGWHHPTHKALSHPKILSAWLTPQGSGIPPSTYPNPPPPLLALHLSPRLLSLYLSLSAPSLLLLSLIVTAWLCRRFCLLLVSPGATACYRWVLRACTMERANQMGTGCSNHWADCLSQSEWLLGVIPRGERGGGRSLEPMVVLFPQQPGIWGYRQSSQWESVCERERDGENDTHSKESSHKYTDLAKKYFQMHK